LSARKLPRRYWHPSHAISEEEEWEALDRCTPEAIAHVCIYGYAVKAFQKHGMAYDAYTLINRGFAGFRPHEDSYSICSTESFLVLLTSNAKFESYAEYARRTPGRGQDVATD
jgi:hypothetical protein